jgi:hypothetical protein
MRHSSNYSTIVGVDFAKDNNSNNNNCLLIDVAIPSDRNVIQKEYKNKLKYKTFKYRNSANVEHEMFCHTGNH